MRAVVWLFLAASASAASIAKAEEAKPPTAAAPAQGVTSYPASYFDGNRPNTAADMVERLPGFTLSNGAQVRGYDGAAGNVIIDGQRPPTKQIDLDSLLRRIPASQVERIDVIRGGAPGIDMQGQTVLANVILKKNTGVTAVVSAVEDALPGSGRYMPSVRVDLSERNDGRSLEASFGVFNFYDNGVGPGPHTQYDNPAVPDSGICTPECTAHLDAKAGGQDYIATVAYQTPFAGGKLRVNALIDDVVYLDREQDVAGSPAAFDDQSRNAQDLFKGELGAHYTGDLSQGLGLELIALEQGQRRLSLSDYTQGDFDHYREGDTLAESILRGVLHWQALKTLVVEGSIEGAYNIQTTRTIYDVDYAPQQLAAADVRIIERRTEAALTATWTPSPKYTFEVGMKVEASNLTSTGDTVLDKTLIYPKPRFVFTWSPDPNDQVRLRFAREVGQLDFNAFISTAALNTTQTVHLGNPNLLPQDVWVSELALERKFWKSGDLTVTLRHSDISDAVDRIEDPSGLFDEPGNIGHAREDELAVDATAPLDRLFLRNGLLKLNATWRDTRVTDPTSLTARPLSQIHPLDWRLDFTQDLTSLKSTWGVSVQGGFHEDYWRFDEIDQYKLADTIQASWEYHPTAKLAFRLELNNLSNAPFEQTYNVYAANRPSPIEYIDWRSEHSGREIHFRVRKTFN
jgi:outer membrane receptor protein involved in Fe transport